MINAKIIVSEIDYEKSFANLFPIAIKKCSGIENPNMPIRFLKKMGDASITAALGVMNLMTERGRGELLCALVNAYSAEIRTALQSYLKKNEFGKNIEFGDIFLVQDSSGHLSLSGYDIRLDYSGLADNDKVQDKIKDIAGNMVGGISKIKWLKEAAADSASFAVKAAAMLAPDEIEKKGIAILEKPENKKKLTTWAAQILEEKGLCLTLEDCFFSREPDSGKRNIGDSEKDKSAFNEELTEELMDAVVRYLKMLLEE